MISPAPENRLISATIYIALSLFISSILALFMMGTRLATAKNVPESVHTEFAETNLVTQAKIDGIAKVVAGNAHTCGLAQDGEVYCWGDNADGQLGDGSQLDRLAPAQVLNLPGIVDSLFAGGNHTCILAQAATIDPELPEPEAPPILAPYCWGSNSRGQLGNESSINSSRPIQVTGLPENSNIISLAGGDSHTCAIIEEGAVYCWGANEFGQLGNDSQEDSSVPVLVSGFGIPEDDDAHIAASMISAGKFHTCAFTTAGVLCWGRNEFGQLGDDTNLDRLMPVQVVASLPEIQSLSLGWLHSCAVSQSGQGFCWGSNFYGQLGNGTDGSSNSSPSPVEVSSAGRDLTAIYSHGHHTCALGESGEIFCWGYNSSGQLGNGTTDNSNRPARVSFTGRKFLATATTGFNHTCGISDAEVYCWGNNFSGQLGNGSRIDQHSPVLVREPLARTFVSYVSFPTAAVQPTPTPKPVWQQVGLNGLKARSIAVTEANAERAISVGLLLESDNNIGLYQGTLDGDCSLPITLGATSIKGSVMDIDFLVNTGVLANYDRLPHYTVNAGQSWTRGSSQEEFRPYSVTFDPMFGWFAGADEGLFRSVDSGATWTLASSSLININTVEAIGNHIWIGTFQNGLQSFNPTDGNITNLTPDFNGGSRNIWDILTVIDEGVPTYFIATSEGVYQGPGDTTWSRVGGSRLDTIEVRSLAHSTDGSDSLFAGTTGSGVWTVELGTISSWQEVTSPGWNSTVTVRALHYEPQVCQGLFAGTDNGLWILASP